MEINLLSQVDDFDFNLYEEDFIYLANETFKLTNQNQDYVLSCILVNDEQIHQINLQYRNIDKETDVISFALKDSDISQFDEIEESLNELGDIFINYDAVIRQAKEYQHSFRREICFLFVHGLLHLLGYDHQNETQEHEMFELQRKIIDPYISIDEQDEE